MLHVTNSQSIKLGEPQLETILIRYFSEKNMPSLIGNRLFKSKEGLNVQLDIEHVDDDLNDIIYLCFEALNKLSKVSGKPFNELLVIIHFKNNDIPLVISANNHCLDKFFNSTIFDKSDWKNNCLNIGNL
jgi:hypothetical protein